ncbi:MAG: glycoside hydrolase family 88 protein [Planctomycetota bacterium]|nr:glycoside hydrolase family 88 protein [Planctomycetota bacterium]
MGSIRKSQGSCVLLALASLAMAFAAPLTAGEEKRVATQLDELLARFEDSSLVRLAIGVSRRQTPIPALLEPADLDVGVRKTRVLVVGGLDGSASSVRGALDVLRWFLADPAARPFHEDFTLSVVPCAYPDRLGADGGQDGGEDGGEDDGQDGGTKAPETPRFPPEGRAYGGVSPPESAYLWRFVGIHAPDILVDVRRGDATVWHVPVAPEMPALRRLGEMLQPSRKLEVATELVVQLVRVPPCRTGTVPAVQLVARPGEGPAAVRELLTHLRHLAPEPSPARRELHRRLRRSPVEVAQQLARRYGRELDSVVYIPAVALMGRLRLGEITRSPRHLAAVQRIVSPYLLGLKGTLPRRPSGSHLSGHLVFAMLARLTGDTRYTELARRAADLGFDADGKPREMMPYHNEMSDAVFMGCPILAWVGRLTGEEKYFDLAVKHLRAMRKLTLRADGLYRHSPLDEAAWGRGNGFPALGLALSIGAMPLRHPGRREMVNALRSHLEALLPHQDPTGCWHQVIDVPGSYRELTATCMITYAMLRAVRSGWIERRDVEPAIRKAWEAIRLRVAADGSLVDVCTGTGKQKNLQAYLDRPAILGPDDRGGAMALLAATEMALREK